MRLLQLILLVVLIVSKSVNAEALAGQQRVWMFAVYTPEVMQFKTQPFFEYLTAQTQIRYQVTISPQVQTLLDQCANNPPEIVMLSRAVAEPILERCAYQPVAKTLQKVILLQPKASEQSLADLKRIGLIENVWASRLARNELPGIIAAPDFQEYPTFYDLLLKAKKDQLEAMVIPDKIFSQAKVFEGEWVQSYVLQGMGEAMVLVSNRVDDKTRDTLKAVLLENESITQMVFQNEIGLGEFLPVDK